MEGGYRVAVRRTPTLHEIHLPFDTASVPVAREFVRARLGRWAGDHHIVELLTTELATNAVLHAHSAFDLSMRIQDGTVRVEVGDASPVIPAPMPAPPVDSVRGRGLFLVASLSSRWGVRGEPGGKCVWFEVGA